MASGVAFTGASLGIRWRRVRGDYILCSEATDGVRSWRGSPSSCATSGCCSYPSSASQSYHEVRLAKSSDLFISNSIILIPNLLTKAECNSLVDAAELHVKNGAIGYGQGLIENWWRAFHTFVSRLGLVTPLEPQSLERLRICDMGYEEQLMATTILRDRVLPFFEEHIPQIARVLFGKTSELHRMSFLFSNNEPAVNRYTKGGEFTVHTDEYPVTVNVLLSEASAFSGGGTAFWSQDATNRARASNILLKPHQGMGVIFNGTVSHSGRPVELGTRHLFVASFALDAPVVATGSSWTQSREASIYYDFSDDPFAWEVQVQHI